MLESAQSPQHLYCRSHNRIQSALLFFKCKLDTISNSLVYILSGDGGIPEFFLYWRLPNLSFPIALTVERLMMSPMQNGSKFTDRLIKYLTKSAEQKTTRVSKSKGHVISAFATIFWECASKNLTWSHLCECMVCAAPKRLLHTACAAEPWHIVAGVRFHWSREREALSARALQ